MRVISQDGYTDIPYEKFIFYKTACNNIIAAKDFGADPDVLFSGEIAKYSTREKALKAMELLREAYLKFARATDDKSFYTFFDNPKVFQFPADDEVKV